MSFQNNILLTGATGFLGKVILKELLRLRAQYSINKVIHLIRPTQKESALERFDHLIKNPCFAELHHGWSDDVEVVECDLGEYHCGIDDAAYASLREMVTHVIHTAGCIKFDSNVTDAISSNIDSSLHVLALAKDCYSLQRLVVTSTAFVTPPREGPIYEHLFELPRPASQMISDLRSGALIKSAAIVLTGYPNIYSLSKCLGENIICQLRGSMPLTIVRPSIISAALDYPRPGWIDSKAAFAGFVLGFGSGALRVVNRCRTTKMDIMPVDKVAGCIIGEAFRHDERGSERSQARIVFSVATAAQSLTLRESCRIVETFFNKGVFRYIRPKGYVFDFYYFIHHSLRVRLAGVTFGGTRLAK